ncbi:hypothetical protein FGO68_gene1900 [Halteria grandinella]|uniref:Uncharacterized protein n=1 Tax=Halteria grandinella TaxID=5974 RepID=A0A8J8NHE8_HALGN|nr:hypothetical protein FGO68_gene1900 [Halteria grandinella]
MQYVWGLLNDLSFLTTLTLISVQIPAIVQVMQSSMLNFIYLDVLKADQWLIPWIFSNSDSSTQISRRQLLEISNLTTSDFSNEEEEDTGLNDFFTNNGYGSTKLIKNLQSAFLFILAIALVSILSPLIQLFRRQFYSKFHNFVENVLIKKQFRLSLTQSVLLFSGFTFSSFLPFFCPQQQISMMQQYLIVQLFIA